MGENYIDISKVRWVGLNYNKAPEINFRQTAPLEDAVAQLIEDYNRKFEQAGPEKLDWFIPDSSIMDYSKIEGIRAECLVEIRRKWKGLKQGYCACCVFLYDGQSAALKRYKGDFLDELRSEDDKIETPETVGDFARIDRNLQSKEKYVTLQIARYGRKILLKRGRSITKRFEP